MNPKRVVLTAGWIGALLLAWQSGPWNKHSGGESTSFGSHDANFHMHQPLHDGGKVSMVGQFHLELVSSKDGSHRLWLSNAFRQEMDPTGFEGRLVIDRGSQPPIEAEFKRVDRGKQLVARSIPLKGQMWLRINGRLGDRAKFDGVKFFWDFDPDAFRLPTPLGLDSMVPLPADNYPTAEKVALGRDLFFDPLLSADRSVACATCHRPEYAFAEPRPITQGIAGRVGRRNTPTLLNSAYLSSLFWDGRSRSLEAQAVEPILNHAEMGFEDEQSVLDRLTPKYGRRTQTVLGTPLSLSSVAMALASFERTLLSGDSNFDRFEAGQKDAISPAARNGRSLFFGKAGCGTCHLPPLFTDFVFHNLGIGWRGSDHGDRGRFEVTRKREDLGAFKTPSLRDVTRTAPYMHDGSVATLRGVIDFYKSGGHANPALDPLIKPLDLTATEIDELLAFLGTLEGRSYDSSRKHSNSAAAAAATTVTDPNSRGNE